MVPNAGIRKGLMHQMRMFNDLLIQATRLLFYNHFLFAWDHCGVYLFLEHRVRLYQIT